MKYQVFYRVELEGLVEVEADSPEASEEIVRTKTPLTALIAGAHCEDARVENVEAQV